MGDDFNQKIGNLPKSLIHLTLGDDFNQKLKNLPKNLTHLTFGYNFNQKILQRELLEKMFDEYYNKEKLTLTLSYNLKKELK